MAILIVTDNPTLNIGLRTIIIGEFPDITIFEAETLQKTLTLTFGQPVDTMVLDAGVADGKNMASLEAFMKTYPQAAVVVYLGDGFEYIYAFAKAGITALISKKSDAVEIAEALHRASKRLRFVSFDIQQILLSDIAAGPESRRKNG
jgi:DNA-binding NarL/FixJ family response regulator